MKSQSHDFAYHSWLQKVKEFIESVPQKLTSQIESSVTIQKPLSPAQLLSLKAAIGRQIPECLCSFLEQGSGGLTFSYKWAPESEKAEMLNEIFRQDSIWGGGRFCDAACLNDWITQCKEWAAETWIAESPDDMEVWTKSFPILLLGTGDFLALDQREPNADPSVIYLSHDDESKVISSSFTSFLWEWQQLYYVGPEFWILEPFLTDEGLLSSETEQAKKFKSLFGK